MFIARKVFQQSDRYIIKTQDHYRPIIISFCPFEQESTLYVISIVNGLYLKDFVRSRLDTLKVKTSFLKSRLRNTGEPITVTD